MLCSFKIHRTKAWLVAQRLATGENVPDAIDLPIEVGDLGDETRAKLLEINCGTYPSVLRSIGWDATGRLRVDYGGWGAEELVVDSEHPMAREIDEAFHAALDVIAEKLKKRQKEEAERAERSRLWRLEEEAAARQVAEARKLLKDELSKQAAKIKELEEAADLMGALIAKVPEDALRGAAKGVARNRESTTAQEVVDMVYKAMPQSKGNCGAIEDLSTSDALVEEGFAG